MEDDLLVWFGGSVKALDDNGKFGGFLVLFGTAEQTDASELRDFFTKDTDFGLDVVDKSRVLYAHAKDPLLKNRSLAVGSIALKDAGIWVEGQLALRDAYEEKIWGMVKDKKLGFSSGTAPHLIRRERQANGSNKILSWPLGLDASLTPCPAEPRTAAVALKSLAFESLKGEHLGPTAEHAAAMSAMRTTHERLGWAVHEAIADDKLSRTAKLAKVKAAHDEARDTNLRVIGSLLPEPPASDATKSIGRMRLAEVLRNLDDLLDD